MSILIVDDNEMVRRGVVLLLSSRPALTVCGEAKSGEEAILKAKQLNPGLVLMDVNMPGANGLEIARKLRREIPLTKIILMSLHAREQLLPRAIAAGADACVDKVNLGTELLPVIESLAGRSDARPGADAD